VENARELVRQEYDWDSIAVRMRPLIEA